MWVLLLLACAPECPNGGEKAGGLCVTSTPEEPPALTCAGTLYTSSSPVDPLRSFCGTCNGVACDWSVETGAQVVAVELDLLGVFEETEWTEYHDGFTLGEDNVWTLQLALVHSFEDYESGATTLLDADASDLSFLWSALDEEGAYIDCAAGGAAAADVAGDCRVVEPG